jgi:ribosomal protein S18 acetylase RimI-like enzyme
MASTLRFRSARPGDSRTMARFYSIASDGVADYVALTEARPGEGILDVGERNYARACYVFGYRNCTLAELDDEIIGMLVSYPVPPPEEDAGDDSIDPVLAPYGRLNQYNSHYICAMAVIPEYRGTGIGARFLSMAQDEARATGSKQLSLLVFEQNAGALRLYRRHGFREADRAPVVPHELIHFTGDVLLMVKDLDATRHP